MPALRHPQHGTLVVLAVTVRAAFRSSRPWAYAELIDANSFPAEVSALETDARAMAHLIEESEAVGINAELPKLIKAMADRSIAAGHGGEQYPVLIEEFGKPGED
ncbi:imine reductase family protein [Nocardia sp. NPDC004260]